MTDQPVVLQLPPANPPEPEKRENAPQPNVGSYKGLLIHYTQKSLKQLPIYQTYNEGAQHKPQFRSRVWIDGAVYTSPSTFSQRKVAEAEVSKIAFEAIMKKIKDEGAKLVQKDTVFCKSIVTEYAVRMSLEIPKYQTTQPDLSLPLFSSSLVFNGATYTGEFARTKLEAQRLAARAVILSILDSESGNIMSEIINSKFKLHTAMKIAMSSVNAQVGTVLGVVHTGNDNGIQLNKASEVEVATGSNYLPTPYTISELYPGQPISLPAADLSVHEIQPSKSPTAVVTHPAILLAPILETTPLVSSTSAVVTPNILVPPVLEQTPLVGSKSENKRYRKNKKKAQKKARLEAQLPLNVVPLSQIPPWSMGQ